MGIRTKHYDHKLKSQVESQTENQPINEPDQVEGGANQVIAEVEGQHQLPPAAAPSTKGKGAKGGGGRGKKKAKAKSSKASNNVVGSVAVDPPPADNPKTPPRPATVTTPKAPEPIIVKPPVATKTPKKSKPAANTKKYSKKRKQKGKGGQDTTVKVLEEKVETKKKSAEASKVENQPSPTPMIFKTDAVVEKQESQSVTDKPIVEATTNPPNSGNVLKNGIMKTNNKMKKGMRNLIKILGRNRNTKKPPRKKSPVKPRILPARASARLCVRKNSGEHEQGLMRSDKPLRTVELIKRPLELREPATKLLYLASLSLYPTADPESDTTPIVIISEEIPNSCGKKPKMRSMELPLLPNWRSANFHSSSRASVVDDPVLLSITSIVSPNCKGTNSGSEKPLRKRKAAEKKSQQETKCTAEGMVLKGKKTKPNAGKNANPKTVENHTASSNNEDNFQLKAALASGTGKFSETKTTEHQIELDPIILKQTLPKPPKVSRGNKKRSKQLMSTPISTPVLPQLLSTPPLAVKSCEDSSLSAMDLSCSIFKYPFDSGLTISPSAPPPVVNSMKLPYAAGAKLTSNPSNQFGPVGTFSISGKPAMSFSLSPAISGKDSKVEKPSSTQFTCNATNAAVQQQSAKSAPVKRKRKSLESIIKEIPKAKSQKVNPEPVSATQMNMNVSNIALPSVNPILEGLMKNPVKKRPSKPKAEQPQSLSLSLVNLQNPVSMTVPLQPAPGNSNVLPTIKELIKPRTKKQMPQFKLPMPLPIPIPPGLLNYASLVPNNTMSDPPKPRRQRKPKAPKTTAAILGVPCLPQRQSHVPPRSSPQQMASIPYLPSHLEAFYHSTPVGNGVKDSIYDDADQALDLCVKAQPIVLPKKIKKAKAPSAAMKSLLKPLNVEEDGPLNLVMNRGIAQVPAVGKKPDSRDSTDTLKHQNSLENVKQMLARLHTKIAPAVNGVQLITIE